jgi:tetracycline 7-halogenase / FADH2 O2-dependent halogenase
MRPDFDLAILGSGFGGSLLAMIARQLGLTVILIERQQHPRFTIGESTTPLANLIWSDLSRYYELPELAPFARWSSWQEHAPKIAVGLKRGFTFYHHQPGHPHQTTAERDTELLVAASASDRDADTHWYRPDFDAHLVRCAQARGVEFSDRTRVESVDFAGDTVRLAGHQLTRPLLIRARFVIDATGPRGALSRLLQLPTPPSPPQPQTQGLYSHFLDVERWDSLHPNPESPPYPVDDAALHHIFPGGWIWILRFNNGITSAGVACCHALARSLRLEGGLPAWHQLLDQLPSVGAQFTDAKPLFPMVHANPLPFRSDQVAGPCWALLPSAAGFIDPLLSTGFPLALLGIERLARLLEQDWQRPRFHTHLDLYSQTTQQELDRVQGLISALYHTMIDFPVFTQLALLYFAAAAFTENARRQHRPQIAGRRFLLADHPAFGTGLTSICQQTSTLYSDGSPSPGQRTQLLQQIQALLQPVDLGGLSDPAHRNWHPLAALRERSG